MHIFNKTTIRAIIDNNQLRYKELVTYPFRNTTKKEINLNSRLNCMKKPEKSVKELTEECNRLSVSLLTEKVKKLRSEQEVLKKRIERLTQSRDLEKQV